MKDAIFFIRKNAETLKINRNQIIAIGSSAGAHLAFASFITEEKFNKKFFNSRPNYIIVISPVIRNDKKGYGYEKIDLKYKSFSSYHLYMNTKKKLPPSLIFSRIRNNLINFHDLKKLHRKSIEKNDEIELFSISKICELKKSVNLNL